MVTPQLALVRPRVVSPESGENRPLDVVVAELLERRDCRVIHLRGGAGAGKTTALAHLAAMPWLGSPIEFLDEPRPAEIANAAALRHVIYASQCSAEFADVSLSLAAWTSDEWME